MRPEQRPIADWIKATLKEKGWTAYRWSKETAGAVVATTIQRAMSEGYEGVTSIRVLHQLAVAADVAAPFQDAGAGVLALSAEQLGAVMPFVLATMGVSKPSAEDLALGCQLLRSALSFLASDPETAGDLSRVRSAMRALTSLPPPLVS